MNATDIPALLSALLAKRTLVVNHIPQGTGLDSARTGEWLRREVKAVEQQLLAAGIDPKLIPWPAPTPRVPLFLMARDESECTRLFGLDLDAMTWTPGWRLAVAVVTVPSTSGGTGHPVVIRRTWEAQDQRTGSSKQVITADDGKAVKVIAEGYEPCPMLSVNNDGTLLVR